MRLKRSNKNQYPDTGNNLLSETTHVQEESKNVSSDHQSHKSYIYPTFPP